MDYPFCILGLDIGGTKIAGGLCVYASPDIAPEVKYQQKCATEAKKGAETLIANALNIAKSIIEAARNDGVINDACPIIAAGAGSPGRCEKSTTTVMTETCNFPGYKGTNWNEIFQREFSLPCALLNDVQSHTLGEARWGSGRGMKNVVLLAFGTGVGGACVVDGKLLTGSHGYAGELGHICNPYAIGYECACGKASHLESVGSGWGIERVYEQRTGNKLTGGEISELANKGDADALACIKLAGRAAGNTIAQLQTIFDPEVIIVTGSVAKAGKIWRDELDAGIKEELIEELHQHVNIKPALLGEKAPIIGAAECALDRVCQTVG